MRNKLVELYFIGVCGIYLVIIIRFLSHSVTGENHKKDVCILIILIMLSVLLSAMLLCALLNLWRWIDF